MVTMTLVGAATLVTFCACVLFVLHRDFECGVAGAVGYALVAVGAFARFFTIIGHGANTHISLVALVTWVGIALVMARTAYNFMRRSRRRGPYWHEAQRGGG